MTTIQDVLDGVQVFIDAYDVYIAAGLIIGFATWALRRFVKFGR